MPIPVRSLQEMMYLSTPSLLWSWFRRIACNSQTTAWNEWAKLSRRRVATFRWLTIVDGEKVSFDVDGMVCVSCKNYYLVRHAAIEVPPYCPYCGIRYQHVDFISAEKFNDRDDL